MLRGRIILSALRGVRHLPERLLHPYRRSRLREALRKSGVPYSVLFICHGNIYRSPYAAHRFAALIPSPFQAAVQTSSAGFIGARRRCPENAIARAALAGVDLRGHESSLLSAEQVREASLIVVMDPRQKRAIRRRFSLPADRVAVLGDLDPDPIDRRTIRDPWGESDEVLAASYDRIDRCVRALVDCIPGFAGGG